MKLSELQPGQSAVIRRVSGSGQFRKRILEMGFIQGKEVTALQGAPMMDPMQYRILGYVVSLRREDARFIDISLLPAEREIEDIEDHDTPLAPGALAPMQGFGNSSESRRPLRVALVGNPNCGKTSLFNQASGAHEHVGNYSGVTVERKTGYIDYGGYHIELIDLPGSYSLSPYSPEEMYIRDYLTGTDKPDVVLNVIDTTNIERNLYLTLQIKEMGLPVVVALNMFDEFMSRKEYLDYPRLARLIGVPMIPTVSRSGLGLQALFGQIIEVWEGIQKGDPAIIDTEQGKIRPINVSYGTSLEIALSSITAKVQKHLDIPSEVSARYIAIKLLESDPAMAQRLMNEYARGAFVLSARDYTLKKLANEDNISDIEELMTDARYGYIAGALRETYRPHLKHRKTLTDTIDHIVTHRWLGFPIFLGLMFLMFAATFWIGQYPMDWIDRAVASLSDGLARLMTDGPLKDLLIEGIIGGVGGVIVFLPNILILYLFISLFEDSGYMARAAFIMDKLMHRMGLHGKSFIPLIMGFGCNVPAVMATRTIESRKSRIITMLVLPFMSCSARLPVYLLLAGAVFPSHAPLVLFGLYITGVILAVISARVLRGTVFDGEDIPFVMELPPYRMPTLRSIIRHMWNKAQQYLQKMGTIILLASIVMWFLGYFPRQTEAEELMTERIVLIESSQLSDEDKANQISALESAHHQYHQENSWIGRLGKATEPIIAPLGFDWKMGISLLSGMAAKEIVVSTLGVIYTGDGDDGDEATQRLSQRIVSERRADGTPSFTPMVAIAFMLFVLIYFPCIATIVAIGRESGSWRWGAFSVIYSCVLAWAVAFAVFQIGSRLFV